MKIIEPKIYTDHQVFPGGNLVVSLPGFKGFTLHAALEHSEKLEKALKGKFKILIQYEDSEGRL